VASALEDALAADGLGVAVADNKQSPEPYTLQTQVAFALEEDALAADSLATAVNESNPFSEF